MSSSPRMEAGFEQQADAVLEMEIARATPGTLYDQIHSRPPVLPPQKELSKAV